MRHRSRSLRYGRFDLPAGYTGSTIWVHFAVTGPERLAESLETNATNLRNGRDKPVLDPAIHELPEDWRGPPDQVRRK